MTTGRRGEILADEFGRTANPRIWAAGDVTGGPQFVYVAAAEGSAAAAHALAGAGRAVDCAALPQVTFTSPAITPTAHRVELDGLPAVWAMCAIDALGLPAMAGRDGRITSADPADGTPIEVTVRDRHPAHWPGVTGGMQGGRQFLGGRYDGGAR